ncbi:hypothetical protein AN958_10556 [Leucoagaricus sp. SymC.cos]|nr:hypothetical protein AN958_10556 [Leucoagaricus sp. SymC.cos]
MDIAKYLRSEFARIWERNDSDNSWPSTNALQIIISTSSGLFALAARLIRFIEDLTIDDPCYQLEACLDFFSSPRVSAAINPLHALDLLYRQICSNITNHLLPTTKCILGLCTLYMTPNPPSVQVLANFLGLDRRRFYGSLKRLHSVLKIPFDADVHNTPIQFYHTSFQDYLIDPLRSGEFSIDRAAVHLDVAVRALRHQIDRDVGEIVSNVSQRSC